MQRFLFVLCAVLFMSSQAQAGPIFDDFDDGNLATNTGVGAAGTGFDARTVLNGTSTEVPSNAVFSSTSENASLNHIVSKDPLAPDTLTVTWSFTSWANPGGRMFASLSKDTAASYVPLNLGTGCCATPTDGLLVRIDGTTRGDAFRFAMNDAGSASQYEFVDNPIGGSIINFNNPFDLVLSVDTIGYTLSVKQGGGDVIGPLSGNWSDLGKSLADIVDVNGKLRVGAGMQGQFSGTSTLSLDKINVVPEPTTIVLAGLPLLVLARRRRNRA